MVLKDKRDHCFFVCNLRPDFKKVKFDVRRSLEPFKDLDGRSNPKLIDIIINCLLTTDLSWRNNRSRTGPQTLFNFRRNGNRQWIPFTFHVYSQNLATTKDVHSTATECKWLTIRFTTMIQCNPSAHTAWLINVNMLRYSCIPMIYAGQHNWNRAWWLRRGVSVGIG